MRHQLPFALLLAACVNNASDVEDVTSDLELENGGLDTTDESPMFAADAAYSAAAIESEATVDDSVTSNDPSVVAMNQSPTTQGRDVILLWGQLPGNPAQQVARNWSGRWELSRGAMVVRRTIAFEDATDRLLPRPNPRTVAFRSVTRPFADGLYLGVIDPQPTATEPLTLTYTSEAPTPVSYTIDLAQLANGPVVIDAGDGNKIIALGHRPNPSCSGGFMRGRWHALSPDAGRFLGVVTNRIGEPVGHVRGIYGVRTNGDHVLFGKFIDRQGHFMGLLVGTYENGQFHARWKARGDDDHGVIAGRYFEANTEHAGMFGARWAETGCSEDQP